ncbi:single-stranded DNA-binding protein [Arthrobacter russicus]|uniref:single-stranded DNA-binding protein n=1 Tax=Bacillati TaxID=1783272 RepID=UPI00321BBBD5
MAQIIFTGHLTKDPDRKSTATGKKKLTFTVAENHRRFNKETRKWEAVGVTFHNVELWEFIAVRAAGAIGKGDLVTITGEQQSRSYKDSAGKDATYLYVTGSDVAKPVGIAGPSATQGSVALEPAPVEEPPAAEPALPGWDAEADAAWKATGATQQ